MDIPLRSGTAVAALGLIGAALLNEFTEQWWINAAIVVFAGLVVLVVSRFDETSFRIDWPGAQVGWVRRLGGVLIVAGGVAMGVFAWIDHHQVEGKCALARQLVSEAEGWYATGLRTDSHGAPFETFKTDFEAWWKNTNQTLKDRFAEENVNLKAPATIDCPSAFNGQSMEYGGYIHGICTAVDNLRRLAARCDP